MSNVRTAHSSEVLRGKLAAVRNKRLFVDLGAGVSWLVLAAAALLAAGMLIDWKYDLTRDLRMLFLMIDATVLFIIFLRHIYTPLTNQPNDDEVALQVEKSDQFADFRSRLIATTQLGEANLPQGIAGMLVRALVKQTEEMARPKNFNIIVPVDGFARAFVLALLVAGLGVLAYNKYQPDSGDLLKRAFLTQDVDVPRFTHIDEITVKPGNVIARGDDLTIEATLKETSRVKPPTAVIAIKYASAARATPHTRTNNAAGIYSLPLENVRESFEVIVTANDARKTSKVTVVSRPAVREIVFEQEFPAYTGLIKPQPRRRGDLTLLENSKLKVTVTANKPVESGYASIINAEGDASTVPMVVDEDKSSLASATLPLQDLNIIGFSVKLKDKHGFESRNEALYRITMLPDKPPVVRVLEPLRKESKVTQRARLPIMVSVKDDYGVKQLRLMYVIGNAPPQPLLLGTDQAIGRLKRVEHDWKIVDLKPPVGTNIEYWIEAEDGRDPKPGVGESRHLYAVVVTDDEKRRDLQNRATDSITGVNETAINQEKLNRELGEIIRARIIISPKEDE